MSSAASRPEPRGRVLVIAGSDSGGGAGIQADIKAIAAMGGYATTAITAVTAQNTRGVTAVEVLPAAMVQAQIDAVLEDIGTDAVKLGMLASADIAGTVADRLDELDPAIPVVFDPVMLATSGDRLLDSDAETVLRDRILPRAALVTPNRLEAEYLTGCDITDLEGQIAAGKALVSMGASAALIKGGHMDGDVLRDVLIAPQGIEIMERSRLDTPHTHGTGCTLASAIAGLLAQGHALRQAVKRAGDYLHEAIRHAPGLGEGHGPVDHMWVLRD